MVWKHKMQFEIYIPLLHDTLNYNKLVVFKMQKL